MDFPPLPEALMPLIGNTNDLTHDEQLALACLDRAINTHNTEPNYPSQSQARVDRIKKTTAEYVLLIKKWIPDA